MSITILEVLEAANYNLQNNGSFGVEIGKEQLKNALILLDNGKTLEDDFEGSDLN